MTNPTPGTKDNLKHQIFLILCKLTGADDEDHEESAEEAYVAKLIMRLVLTNREQYALEAIKRLFPKYDTVTNPGYTFMINKDELDAELQRLQEGAAQKERDG